MDSSGLQDLPGSLSLGSTLPSGFDHNDPQSFQGFSHSIEHGMPATTAFQTVVPPPRPGNFDPRDNNANTNPRYQAPPPSRPAQGVNSSSNTTSNTTTHMGPNQPTQKSLAPASSRNTDDVGELSWIPPLIPSVSEAIANHTSTAQSQEAVGFLSGGPGVVIENKDSHFGTMKIVPNPPDLDAWRERLFNVDEPITLTEEQFKTYFPHIDNVYSHRSTQKYKRKPFVSHYWDCRLKGRPPGTPKSDDPNKKKRKRTARERDLCDVKIKITEHYPGTTPAADSELGDAIDMLSTVGHSMAAAEAAAFFGNAAPSRGDGQQHRNQQQQQQQQPFGILTPSPALPTAHPGSRGQKYYTIQRVNGNGGNGKTGGIGGGHKHTLEESDRVKKNSVHRHLLKASKEKKDVTQPKTFHNKATGQAQLTVKKRSKECDLKLFANCSCPFVQKVWIALEMKGIPYQYIEVDPHTKKPDLLLAVDPRGRVPTLRDGHWGCYESNVLLEYLDDIDVGIPLLPPGDAKLRAHCRLWADHVQRYIIPSWYNLLMEKDPLKQGASAEELKANIAKLVNASHVQGPFFLGPAMSYVDIQIAPWILRLSRVLKPFRGWTESEMGTRWANWVQAVEENEYVMATTSSDEVYLDNYVRYFESVQKNNDS